jgi:hypothetical protein
MMNYAELAEQDLEWSSAAVEGKVNKLVGVRFEQGGMRWIQERAQSLLHLRCIEQNGDWATFMNRAMGKVGERADASNASSPLPSPPSRKPHNPCRAEELHPRVLGARAASSCVARRPRVACPGRPGGASAQVARLRRHLPPARSAGAR